jgi:signal transduction histidine kinase
MALDLVRRRDADQRDALARLHDQRQALESAAQARDAVRHERYRSAQVLAHEVRQPLHNASVALQAALAALRGGAPVDESVRAVARAQGVLRRVTASLDNTVAAASLLTREAHAMRQEVELAVLVQLCVDDLPPDLRARVRVAHLADVRSAALDLGLMRLALRNLLINAALYAPPDTEVLVRLLDSEHPLGLVIEVVDEGPGLPPPVAAGLEAMDSNPQTTVSPTHGLGLGIVQRVMRLHGGALAWRPNQPRGSVMRMLLPQAMPD